MPGGVGTCGLLCLAGLVSVGVWSGAFLGSEKQREQWEQRGRPLSSSEGVGGQI